MTSQLSTAWILKPGTRPSLLIKVFEMPWFPWNLQLYPLLCNLFSVAMRAFRLERVETDSIENGPNLNPTRYLWLAYKRPRPQKIACALCILIVLRHGILTPYNSMWTPGAKAAHHEKSIPSDLYVKSINAVVGYHLVVFEISCRNQSGISLEATILPCPFFPRPKTSRLHSSTSSGI